MKHKRESSLDGIGGGRASKMTADELRNYFALVHPHVPLQAYDNLLLQYAPSPLVSDDEEPAAPTPSPQRQALKSSRKKVGDEMYETTPSVDLKFLLPEDTLTVYSHKAFPEQFEFSLHYIDRVTGQLKSVLAPHQTKLRSMLKISKPSGPMRSSVSGPYNQVTFTAPATAKSAYSGFSGSSFRKAGILEMLPEIIKSERSASAFFSAPPVSPTPTRPLTAPSTPLSGSPRNASPNSSSDDSNIPHFVSSALLTSSFQSNQLNHNATQPTPRSVVPVAISFRTRITSNGSETIVASPLFIIADTVDQVDLYICRLFRNALPKSYPYPATDVLDSLPPKPESSSGSKKSSKSEKSDKLEISDKSDKSDKSSEGKKSKSSSASSKSEHKSESKRESKKKTSHSKVHSNGKADSATTIVSGRCKPEAAAVETTSRFHALKFW